MTQQAEHNRVTQLVNYFEHPELVKWKISKGLREANRIANATAKIGTEVDQIIRSGDLVVKCKKKAEVTNCLEGFKRWKEHYGVGEISHPDRVVDETIGVTGELDIYWNRTIIDVKCTNRISPSYFFQLGGYKRIYRELEVEKVGVLRLTKGMAGYEYITNEDLGLSLDLLVDAFESTYKHFKYYECIGERLKQKGGLL